MSKKAEKIKRIEEIKARAAKVKEGHVKCRELSSHHWGAMRMYGIAAHTKALKDAKSIGITLANKDSEKFAKIDKLARASMLKALRREAK